VRYNGLDVYLCTSGGESAKGKIYVPGADCSLVRIMLRLGLVKPPYIGIKGYEILNGDIKGRFDGKENYLSVLCGDRLGFGKGSKELSIRVF